METPPSVQNCHEIKVKLNSTYFVSLLERAFDGIGDGINDRFNNLSYLMISRNIRSGLDFLSNIGMINMSVNLMFLFRS